MYSEHPGPIGIFDSGYGGLTILNEIRHLLPQYDYIYLGDNARAPYGSRSFEVVYQFTRQAVMKLFERGRHLVILGCNTASAKALRSIQQRVLPELCPNRRVLGIIHPTAESIGSLTTTRHIGILATEGTIRSKAYSLEIAKLFPDIQVSGQACPLWAAIVEANEADSPGADYFVKKRIDQLLQKDADIDAIVLGCTHYPLLTGVISLVMGDGVTLVSSADETAKDVYRALTAHDLLRGDGAGPPRHRFLATGDPEPFARLGRRFLGPEGGVVGSLTLRGMEVAG